MRATGRAWRAPAFAGSGGGGERFAGVFLADAALPAGADDAAASPGVTAAAAAGCLPRRKRPKRPPRSGAAAIRALHSSSVRLFGSRSFGTLAFFFLSVT